MGTDVLPKFIASQLLEPAYDLDASVRVTCHEGKLDQLLSDMALYNLDLVLADAPVGTATRVRAYNHLLGECGIIFVATRSLADGLRDGFPESLNGSPFLLPTDNTELRRSLDRWFGAHDIHPDIVAELEDSALIKAFGQSGRGVLAIPEIIEREAAAAYGLYRIGRVTTIRERFYAISPERRLKHPAVIAIAEEARFMLASDR